MKIDEAKLCVNCDEVFSYCDSKDGSCPACGSSVTFFVAPAWVNGSCAIEGANKEHACIES